MSELGEQIKELREKADMLDGLEGMDNLVRMLREAADTIESLRNRMQEENDALRDYRASQIAAEAERRLQEVGGKSNYTRLFGTPERAARTLFEIKCGEKSCKGCPIAEPCAECDVMLDDGEALRAALLEWLRGDTE